MTEWIDLQRWSTGEPITTTKLNAITNDITYLYQRHAAVLNVVGGTNITVSGQIMTKLSGYTLSAKIRKDKHILFGVSFVYGLFSAATGSVVFDILTDDTNFISSGTGTPLTNGLYSVHPTAISSAYPINFIATYVPTETKVVKFQLTAKMTNNTTTCTIYCANSLSQLFAIEV
jgi:hypothetical protein